MLRVTGSRQRLGRLDGVRSCVVVAGGIVALLTPLLAHAATGTFGVITGQFFANLPQSGPFSATPATPVVFTQIFPTINFNASAAAVPCSNVTGINETTRPFTDVIPRPDGSCVTLVAQANGEKAGSNDLYSFQAVFRGTLTIGPGDVTFHLSSDDAWILGVGPGPDGAQPSFVSGAYVNAPTKTSFAGYQTVGADNEQSSPTENDLVVHFPVAGTYPFELDYTECCGGELLLTMTADGGLLPANVPPDCSAAAASITSLWPPAHRFADVSVTGVTDPDGDPVTITVTGVTQDEPINGKGENNICPDASGVGTGTASLRVERQEGGDGRTYHVDFLADDGRGGQCMGNVTACVPPNQNQSCVDEATGVDSTDPTCVGACAAGCAIEGMLARLPCGGQNLPAALVQRLDAARQLVARAVSTSSRGRSRKLMRRGLALAKQAGKLAGRLAHKGQISAACASSVATEVSAAKTGGDRWIGAR